MVAKSWFRSLWRSSNQSENPDKKLVIGVLSFEVASLMSKLVCQMETLSDQRVVSMWEEVTNTEGIRKLVSENDDYVASLICAEIVSDLGNVAKSVARLGKKCTVPAFNSLELVFDDLNKGELHGLGISWKNMEPMAKKMKKLISATENLCQEMRTLAELEATIWRMKSPSASDSDNSGKWLSKHQKKVEKKRQEVRDLQGDSLWGKTYDHAVMLMAKSLMTIFSRIKHVFGIGRDSDVADARLFYSGQLSHTPHVSTSHSSPLGNPSSVPGPKYDALASAKNAFIFHSGPLEKSSPKVTPVPRGNIFGLKRSQPYAQQHGPRSRYSLSMFKPKVPGGAKGSTKELFALASSSSVDILNFRSSCKLLEAPCHSLGAAALALHYANIILLIEHIFQSPHLIAHGTRDNLYRMLPSRIRTSLRAELKTPVKACSSSVSDVVFAGQWKDKTSKTLQWLAPLAHNTKRWQSAHGYEQQTSSCGSNVLLVQTLYFADQDMTELLITELLVGVNFVWRFAREIDAKAFLDCARTVKFDGCLEDGRDY